MQTKKYTSRQIIFFIDNGWAAARLSLIVTLSASLRLYNLGTESFWFDEIITAHRMQQDVQTLVYQIFTQGSMIRNALYYLLAYLWVFPFEVTEVSIRSLSVLFGVLSVVMMYLVGRQLFGEKVGLLSSFFMAVSSFQIQYSQEARFYSLFVLLTLVSVYYYILALRTKRTGLWIANALINILLFYTHTYAVFIFAVEYIHCFIYLRSDRKFLMQWGVSQILLMVAILAGFVSVFREGGVSSLSSGLAWIPVPSFRDLLSIVYGYLFPQNYQHSWFFIGVSFAVGAAFFIVGAFFYNIKNDWRIVLDEWRRSARFLPRNISSEFVLVLFWFVFPVMVPFIYSNIFSPILVDRYTICAAPAFYLLVAITISRISRVVPVYVSLCALMIVILPGLQDYYVADVNEQWQEVAAFVDENSGIGDTVILAPDDDGYQTVSFDWYYAGALPSCGVGSNIKDEQAIMGTLSPCLLGYDRYWVIMRGPSEVVNRYTAFFLNPNRTDMRLVREKQFVMISVYLFESTK